MTGTVATAFSAAFRPSPAAGDDQVDHLPAGWRARQAPPAPPPTRLTQPRRQPGALGRLGGDLGEHRRWCASRSRIRAGRWRCRTSGRGPPRRSSRSAGPRRPRRPRPAGRGPCARRARWEGGGRRSPRPPDRGARRCGERPRAMSAIGPRRGAGGRAGRRQISASRARCMSRSLASRISGVRSSSAAAIASSAASLTPVSVRASARAACLASRQISAIDGDGDRHCYRVEASEPVSQKWRFPSGHSWTKPGVAGPVKPVLVARARRHVAIRRSVQRTHPDVPKTF